MGYSNDLRVRVIQVVEGGAAARAAARQFVIGDATAIRWAKRWRETGSFEAKSNKGQSRSPLKKHEEWLLALVRQEPDLTLEEIQRRLLDERDELQRGQQSMFGVLPAQQRLDTGDPLRLKVDLGLVVQDELAPLQSQPDLTQQHQLRGGETVIGRRVDLDPAEMRLGAGERHVGTP